MLKPTVFESPAHRADAAIAELPGQRERRAQATRILVDALFIGSLGDALLHDGFGIGLFLLAMAFAATFLHAVRQRGGRLRREHVAWLGTALFFAGAFAWRDSEDLLFYDFLAMLAAFTLLGATVSEASPMRSVLGQRCRDLAFAFRRTVANGFTGVARAFGESSIAALPLSLRHSGRAMRAARAALLTLPLLIVFGILFGSADPMFVSLLSLPDINVGLLASHIILAFVIAWIVGGWLQGSMGDREKRVVPPTRISLSLGALDVTIILGALVALFTLFVGVQIGWLFGGERLVRSTTGLGYAQYARHGFFELVLVSLLVLPVLLGTRAALAERDEAAIRRHRLLAIPLLVLVGGVMASALGRMTLYVHFYGLSTDRLFASVFMTWLAVVFLWLGLTTLRGQTENFAAGMVITGFMMMAALTAADPARLVAKVNVARATTALSVADSATASHPASAIDYAYLTRLGGDAAGDVVEALITPPIAALGTSAREAEVRQRCDAVRSLLDAWGSAAPPRDWRRWNRGTWRARQATREHEEALRAVTCWDAGSERPFGSRDRRPAAPGEQWYVPPHA